jgi:transcriptional regulator with XRE-family HTH domain
MAPFDFQKIQSEFLRAARGNRSQASFSEILGYRSNKVHRWETNQTILSWSDFCHLCQKRRLPLSEACRIAFAYDGQVTDSKALLTILFGQRKLSEIARQVGVSPSLVSRWRSGQVEPSFVQMAQIIHNGFSSLPEFIGRLVRIEKVPSLAAELDREREEKEIHYRNPWVAALLLFLRTIDYDSLPAHQEGFLAKKLGVPIGEERKIVARLLEIGAIQKEKNREIYEPSSRSINVGGDPEGNRRIREYWTERCLKTIRKGLPNRERNAWGYMLLNTNSETRRKIRERYLAFYQDVHNIIQSSQAPCDSVYLMNMQFLNIDELEK